MAEELTTSPYSVKETNPSENHIARALGISEEREKQLDDIIMHSIVRHGSITECMQYLTEQAHFINGNEFAYAFFHLGSGIRKMKDMHDAFSKMESMGLPLPGMDRRESEATGDKALTRQKIIN